jgi:short-subunit dehydrogenase
MILSNSEKTRLLSKYGEWAIVTGASSGIGMALAKHLATAGFNLIINARREDALRELAQQIQQISQVEIKLVPADLSTNEGLARLLETANGLNIGLLVASAGRGTSGLFIENTLDEEVGMLRLNCEALLQLTHHYSKQFAAQKRGGIILLSSVLAFQGAPYAANYAATKAYVQTLAEGLAQELKPHGVDVLAAAPGPVESGFAERASMKMSNAMTPEQVAVPILKALGQTTTTYPGYLSKLIVYSLSTVPRWAKVKIMGKIMGGMAVR